MLLLLRIFILLMNALDNKKIVSKLKECDIKGFTKFDKVVDENIIKECELTALTLFKKYSPERFSKFTNPTFQDIEFSNAIIDLKKSDKKLFGIIYDTLKSSLSLKNLSTHPLLVDLACKFLNTGVSSLMIRSTNIRLDVPGDRNNILDWHYDLYSHDPNHIPSGGLTMVVPFTKFSIENGCPEVCLGSHKKNTKSEFVQGHGNVSIKHSIDNSYLESFEKVRMIAYPQDLIVFPFLTVHKSGFNISNEVRVSALIRYYSYDDDSFEPMNETFSPIL